MSNLRNVLYLVIWSAFAAAAFLVGSLLASIAEAQCANGQCSNGQCWQTPQSWSVQRPQAPAARCPYPSLVIVRFVNGPEAYCGTGFVVDRDRNGKTAVVVTCAHGYKALMKVEVQTQDKKRYDAAILGIDPVQDLCVLRIADPGLTPMRISPEPPQVGDRLFLCGFAKTVYFHGSWGKLRQWASPTQSGETTFLETTCDSIEGCSGGPIINEKGMVVGLVTGNMPGGTGPCLAKTLSKMVFHQYTLPWRKKIENAEKEQAKALGQINARIGSLASVPAMPQPTPAVDLSPIEQQLAELRASIPLQAPTPAPAQPDPAAQQALAVAQQASQGVQQLKGEVDQIGSAVAPLVKLQAKLEADAEAGGIKGRIAGKILDATEGGGDSLRHELFVGFIVVAVIGVVLFCVIHLLRTGNGPVKQLVEKLSEKHPENERLQALSAKLGELDARILAAAGKTSATTAATAATTATPAA